MITGRKKVLTSVVHISEIANVIESLSNLTTSINVIENIINNENIVIKEVTVQDYTEAIIVFFIIAATGAKRELNLVLVMGGCWAECAEDLNSL